MSKQSSIEWTDSTWNVVTGCSKVSQGCKHCYAETIANRFWAKQYPANPDGSPRRFTDVRCHPERLEDPLKWRKPQRVFVNSMSDLFHPDVPDEFIARVFATMFTAYWHTFQVLTKRPARMMEWVNQYVSDYLIREANHVWLGVSVENQQAADERIPLLLQTPAAVRFLSCEPLLGPVDLTNLTIPARLNLTGKKLDWVIVGGESGQGARPMNPDWARSLRDQCQAANVPYFFKQWGAWAPAYELDEHPELQAKILLGRVERHEFPDGIGGERESYRVGKKAAGRLLDGKEWNEYPQQL